MNLRLDRYALAALQLNVVKLECHLGVLALRACLYAENMAYQLRPLRDLGSVGSFYRRVGLDHYTVAGFGSLRVQLAHELAVDWTHCYCRGCGCFLACGRTSWRSRFWRVLLSGWGSW